MKWRKPNSRITRAVGVGDTLGLVRLRMGKEILQKACSFLFGAAECIMRLIEIPTKHGIVQTVPTVAPVSGATTKKASHAVSRTPWIDRKLNQNESAICCRL